VPHRRSADSRFTGVDACPGGWVAVTLSGAGAGAGAGARSGAGGAAIPPAVTVTVARTLDGLGLAGGTGIDMPLGLLAAGWRTADLLARRALGRRGSCVFAIPPRPVWQQPAYANANQSCRELTGRGMSIQAWGLRGKLLEADEFRRAAAAPLYEVHPELSFAALAGGAPVTDSKHTPSGRAIRRALLARAGIALPPRVTGAAEDDLLDAAAVAWSAGRVAAGAAVTLGDPAQRADDGREIAIRY
jgi:predicted RNase H-like nuclease